MTAARRTQDLRQRMFHLRMDELQHAGLMHLSERLDLSASALVRLAVEQMLRRRSPEYRSARRTADEAREEAAEAEEAT